MGVTLATSGERAVVAIEGAGHGDFGTMADDRVRQFFAKYLRGESVEISTAPMKLTKLPRPDDKLPSCRRRI